MNGSSAGNEQLIGKFHVTNVEKIPAPDDSTPHTVSIPDESGCASRFQMIRVDRNFGRGRWKVNDYEPPENASVAIIPPINTIENESNVQPSTNMSTVVNGDSNVAPPPPAVFQQQYMAQNNTPAVVSTTNVPPPTGLLHGYPPGVLPNQSYLLSNPHPQYGYYSFYAHPYSHYAPPWPTAPPNPYLQHPTLPPPSTANLNDPLRLSDTVLDNNGENTFPNPITDLLQNPQLAAYLYALQHSHSPYIAQPSSTTSSYATIPSYHPVPAPHPTILPPQTLPLHQNISNNTTDTQQSHQPPTLTSPKHDGTNTLLHQITPKPKPSIPTVFNNTNNDPTKNIHITDLITSSPALTTARPIPPSLISPINIPPTNIPTASLNDIWPYVTNGSPLDLTQTAATTAMDLLNKESRQNTEIPTEFLKELTTPTKQNNTADIDNKISAAMDLVKMHLLSAVREEVTELRQQIRTLNEKLAGMEHENAFLRQYVPSEIYAQFIPSICTTLSSSNDSTTNPITSMASVSSSQPVPFTSLSTIPSASGQQTTLSTNQPQPTNFPLT